VHFVGDRHGTKWNSPENFQCVLGKAELIPQYPEHSIAYQYRTINVTSHVHAIFTGRLSL
jgi:hypothetical protein